MQRIVFNTLNKWKKNPERKPLILRGARQVGKTTTIRHFSNQFEDMVELNFEFNPQLSSIFEKTRDPKQILTDLQIIAKKKITPGKTLLFLDEVQICPDALIALRYFYELMPELHVIAAGSLLEFAIEKMGLPVGRVNFLHMYPMSFQEFLWALNESLLAEAILKQEPSKPFSDVVHHKALRLLGEYMAIGGMPEAVACWRDNKDYAACVDIHHDIITAYRQDFEKYARKAQVKYVEHVFDHISLQLADKLQYSKFPGNYRKRELFPAYDLLRRANILSPITQTSATGVPLAADSNPENIKVIMLDVALTQTLLGLTSQQWILDPEEAFFNKGAVAEAFIGQELLAYANPRQEMQLYYWERCKRGSEAEVDYLIAQSGQVIPIEVKSGKGSSLRSMHMFLEYSSDSPYGIRFSTQNFSIYEKIHSFPLYAVIAALNQPL